MGKINYCKKLNPIYIESVEANHIYMNDYAEQTGKRVEYKIGNSWFEFQKAKTRKAVLTDSLFLRYMNNKITRNSGDLCRDFIVVKFNYDAEYRIGNLEEKVDHRDLRKLYYKNGVTYTFEKKNRTGETVDKKQIHYKMLMRSTGKAKNGECVFIRDSLHHKAINFLTMGLYDLMDKQSQADPEKVFKLVELSAYQTLTTATSKGYIQIPLENILIIKDAEVFSNGMNAAIVELQDKTGECKTEYTRKECAVDRVLDARIKNILWDGMGLIDESVVPPNMNGFIYCRSHFFKSCLFRGNIQDFFRDYCAENGKDYDTYTMEKTDMFGRKIKLKDVKAVITDKSLKWLNKFVDMMGGTDKKAYRYYRNYMKRFDDYFSIVKTAHSSRWGICSCRHTR